jgi:hypothetical protein
VLEIRELGGTRIGTTAAAAILDEWKARLAATAATAQAAVPTPGEPA